MTPNVVDVKPLDDFNLWIKFEDGKSGKLCLEGELKYPIFEPLKDKKFFDSVFIDPGFHALTWTNGADLAPEYVYEHTI